MEGLSRPPSGSLSFVEALRRRDGTGNHGFLCLLPFFDRIDPRSEALHPDSIIGIQYYTLEVDGVA